MKLKRIVLHGFKSFANRTVIRVADGITAIIGPNGSGKSNILDAVRWLFGEHSLKTLRADEKYDVIFAGSDRVPPSGKARVEMVFEMDGEEVSIAKELSRDGKISYYMNDRVVRLKDIKEMFKGTGAGRDFYSVIAQGQVEKVVMASGKELRQLFEEAAGISYYREKKKETLQKLESVQDNLLKLETVITEIDKRLKSLYLRAKRAERYKQYSERLESLKEIYYGNLLMRAEEKRKHLEEEESRARNEIRSIQRELADVESQLSSLRTEMEEMDEKLSTFTKMLENYEKRRQQLVDLKAAYSRRLSELENRYVESTTKIYSLKEEREKLIKRREEINMIRNSLEAEIDQKLEEVKGVERERNELLKELSEKEKELMKLKEERDSFEKKLLKLESEKIRLEESVEDHKKKLVLIESQMDQKEKRLKGLEREIEEMMKRLDEFSEKERELLKEMEEVKSRKSELKEKREKTINEMNDLMKRKREIETELKILRRNIEEYVGFSRSVREIFKNKSRFRGLYDVVANVIDVDEEFEKAIEALLGGASQNIVVESADVAKEIISFLKDENLGRATFLPLDLVEGRSRKSSGVEKHPGFVGYASDLVRVPEGFEPIVGFLFGGDIVVRTVDDAIDIKRKIKVFGRIATLDGDVVGTKGSITGGSRRSDGETVLSRKTRLKKLGIEMSEIDSELKDLEKEISFIEGELKELRIHEESIEMEIREISSKGASIKRVLEEVLKTTRELSEEIESLKKLGEEYKAKISGMEKRLEKIGEEEKEVRHSIRKLDESLGVRSSELEDKRKEISVLSEKIVDLNMELASLREKKDRYDSEYEVISKRLEEISLQVNVLERETSNLEDQIKSVKNMMMESERELETLKKESEELFESMRIQHSGKEEKLAKMKELEERMESLKEKRDELREYVHHIDMEMQMVLMNIQNYRSEVGDIENVERVGEEELSELEKEIEDLKRKIKHIGPVDLSVIEEYAEVEEDYTNRLKQKEDLEEARAKLMEIMKRTENEAREKFMEVFNKVNENFSKFISILFFGGEGRINMISEEDIFETELEISVRKPGRRIQKLQLLSGGEKALVAIALIFSFLKVNPSPFYILDEVDAPLDDYNAERFKELLKESSKEAQFVIITHNKIVMEVADILNGITMSNGVSLVIPAEMLVEA